MSGHVLVKFYDNYADEFDVKGFVVYTTEEWEAWKNGVSDKPMEWYFGTNEYCEYSSKSDLLSRFDVEEISDNEYEVLKKVVGTSFGFFPDFLSE